MTVKVNVNDWCGSHVVLGNSMFPVVEDPDWQTFLKQEKVSSADWIDVGENNAYNNREGDHCYITPVFRHLDERGWWVARTMRSVDAYAVHTFKTQQQAEYFQRRMSCVEAGDWYEADESQPPLTMRAELDDWLMGAAA